MDLRLAERYSKSNDLEDINMNKTFFLIIICVLIVFSTISLIVVLTNRNSLKRDVITEKETAIKIGRALLEEYAAIDADTVLDAVEKKGIWTVYNVFEKEGITDDGNYWEIVGGGIYVEFRKSNGKVIKMWVTE